MTLLSFLSGLVIGACVGLLMSGLCVAASAGDAHLARHLGTDSPGASAGRAPRAS